MDSGVPAVKSPDGAPISTHSRDGRRKILSLIFFKKAACRFFKTPIRGRGDFLLRADVRR